MKTVNLKQNSENENENELSSVKLKRLKKKVKNKLLALKILWIYKSQQKRK